MVQVMGKKGEQAVLELDKRLRQTFVDGLRRFEAAMVAKCTPKRKPAKPTEPATEPEVVDEASAAMAAATEPGLAAAVDGNGARAAMPVAMEPSTEAVAAAAGVAGSAAAVTTLGPSSAKIAANGMAV